MKSHHNWSTKIYPKINSNFSKKKKERKKVDEKSSQSIDENLSQD